MRGVGAHFRGIPSTRLAHGFSVFLAALFLGVLAAGCEEQVAKKPEDLVADGWKYFQVGDYKHAVPAFEQAIQQSGSDADLHQKALYGLATVWNLRRPDYDRPKAAKLYEEALALSPKSDTAAWILLALARMKHIVPPGEDKDFDDLKVLHSDYGPIRQAYQRVIDAFPEHRAGHEAFLYQQSTFVTSLDPAEARQAIAAIGAFIAKHPGSEFESPLYLLMGNAHYNVGQYAEHLACEIKAVETRPIDPTNPNQDYAQPYYQLACIAEFEVGDFNTAREYYQKIIDMYPVDVRGARVPGGPEAHGPRRGPGPGRPTRRQPRQRAVRAPEPRAPERVDTGSHVGHRGRLMNGVSPPHGPAPVLGHGRRRRRHVLRLPGRRWPSSSGRPPQSSRAPPWSTGPTR